jgi:toxin ParE1/3/4
MIRLHIRHLARVDLRQIWQYSFENWGVAQADKYILLIDAAFNSLIERPEQGKPASPNHEGVMRINAGSHMIMFNRNGDTINILRILHQRMDVDQNL